MRLHYLLLALLCVVAVVLRIINLDAHGIGGDEKNSFFVSQFVPMGGANQHDVFFNKAKPYFTPAEFWKEKGITDFYDAGARIDNGSSAAHALLLHYWTNWFGVGDGTLRALSVLFSILLIPLLFVFVRSVFNSPNLALGVAALATIEPLYVGWSQVVRTYTMTFFFCLLATYLFFLILKAEEARKRPVGLYVAYGLCAFLCLMCHYSVFTLFALHGLIVLLFVRNLRTWIGLALAMVIPALGMLWWLKAGGGQYAFRFIEDSKNVYNEMAAKNPQVGYLAPTTPFNAIIQLVPIAINHFLPTNGFFDVLEGKRNWLILFAATVGILGIYRFVRPERIKQGAILGVLVVAFLLYSKTRLQFTCFTAGLLLLAVLIDDTLRQRGAARQRYWAMWLLGMVPLVFLLVYAVQDHNTFRIQHKYVGYSMAFSLVLVALALRALWTYPAWVKYPMAVLLLCQLGFVANTIRHVWEDRSPRYLLYANPRIANPYRSIAQTIEQQYAAGDTIVYPSYKGDDADYTVSPSFYPIIDAQLVNFYLPKTATYWQRVDQHEPNKVLLKKADGRQQVLFDFKGATYRY